MRNPPEVDALLRISGLTTDFPGMRAIDGVSFTIQRGSIVALVGPSGSGKTVTALSVLRLVRHPGRVVAGQVMFEGLDLLRAPEGDLRRIRGGRIAIVFQDPLAALHPAMRVGDQISEAVRAHRPLASSVALSRAIELLDLVGMPLPAQRARAFPHELSSGMRQRAMIAMALAGDPDLLIADEPTAAVDATLQRELLDLFATLRRGRGLSMLLITHDLALGASLADEMLVMANGRIVERGRTRELLAAPKDPATARLVASARILETPGRIPPARTAPLLEVERISKSFDRAHDPALDDVSLHVSAGETLALVGESGSGKTTLARIVLRLIRASSGRVRFGGTDLTSLDAEALRLIRRDLQIVFADPGAALDPRQTVAEIVAEPLEVHGLVAPATKQEGVLELLRGVGLDRSHAHRHPHQLSGGQKQRVAIARALATRPKLIVADEPLTALDVTTQAEIIELIASMQELTGMSLLLIAHDLRVVRRLATRVAVLRAGRLVEIAPADQLYRSPQHPYTRSLLSAVTLLGTAPEPAR